MSTAKKFAGQTAVYGLSTIAGRVLGFFLTPIYTRAYSTGVYGILTTMFGWVSILNAVMSFGMETTYFRYLNKYPDNKKRVYNNSFIAVFVITLFFLLVTLPFLNFITGFIQVGNSTSHNDFLLFIKTFIAILVIDAWCVVPFAKIRADGRPGKYGTIKFLNVIIFITLNLTFIWVIPYWLNHHFIGADWISHWYIKGWVGYVFVSNLVSSIATLFMLLPEFLKLGLDFDKKMFGEMFKYSWPILIANLSFLVNENLDKILLGKLLPQNISVSEVGIYAACAKISLFLSIFVQAFRLGAEPFFFSHAKSKNAGQTYARIMDYFVIAVCVIFVALIANIEILKYFVRGKDHAQTALYWTGLKVVPPLVFGYVSLGIYMNLSVWYKLSDQTKYGLYISGVGAILTIVLNVVFIPKYSYVASAWISFAAYTSMMILSYIWGQKNYPIPYNIKKNLAYIVASVILVYISFTIFKRNIFVGNALLIVFAGTAFYLERKSLLAIFKK
ncbi:oligosaccharide flippase family protein [Mucilaginibacter sp.]|uniref:oligosaccharide flippase family protein n=1 Tax=Mucilaginibacter sp. TaxID=1882438 RepID=UPI0025F0083D|nr:oligosaccharide flippase family protein [Mucilaginibacter sp.]